MKTIRLSIVAAFTLIAALAGAQSWQAAYDAGLKAARAGQWSAARAAFQQAAAYRTEDVSGATTLPGPVTEQRRWRGGAPYSPNFLAAYSAYRMALEAPGEEGAPAFAAAAAEFEAILSKGQQSRETYYFLNQIYTRTNNTEKRLNLEERFRAAKPTFKVDTEVVAPEELAVIGGASGPRNSGPTVTIIQAGAPGTTAGTMSPGGIPTGPTGSVGPVATVPTKYALVVGNASSTLPGYDMPYAADDAQAVREALVTHAGYAEANVDLVLNATREQLLASARALADRMPEDGTVFIYFAGAGANINGKDYLAGVDSGSLGDAASMTAKSEIYSVFMKKGARMFAFFQVARPITNGRYFGQEIPLVGAIAQVQSTIPGGQIYSAVKGGRTIGLFTDAIVGSLSSIRSNQVPIADFGWQIFNRIRGGGAGLSGSGSSQIPTLPVLTHLSPDERF